MWQPATPGGHQHHLKCFFFSAKCWVFEERRGSGHFSFLCFEVEVLFFYRDRVMKGWPFLQLRSI